MRTLSVFLVVSLFAFFLISSEAVATNSPVANNNVAPIEWTAKLPTLSTNDIILKLNLLMVTRLKLLAEDVEELLQADVCVHAVKLWEI